MKLLRMLKTRAALVCATMLLTTACTEQVPQVESPSLVLQVPSGDEALVRALADSLWENYAAPVDTIAFTSDGSLRIVLQRRAFAKPPRMENGQCTSVQFAGLALARVGRAAWRRYGEARGVRGVSVEVNYKSSVGERTGHQTCHGGVGAAYYRPDLWPDLPAE